MLNQYDAEDVIDSLDKKISWEKELLGLSISGSRADRFRVRDKCSDIIRNGYNGMFVELAIEVDDFREILTKKKREPMAFITGSDSSFQLDNIVVFPHVYSQCINVIVPGAVLKINGMIDERGSVQAKELTRLL